MSIRILRYDAKSGKRKAGRKYDVQDQDVSWFLLSSWRVCKEQVSYKERSGYRGILGVHRGVGGLHFPVQANTPCLAALGV